jgi:putative flavoprotein involved in K+ transport
VTREEPIEVIHPAGDRGARQVQGVEQCGDRDLPLLVIPPLVAHRATLYHRGVSGRDDVACLVVGAGPAGLATSACLRAWAVPFLLVDRAGAPGGAYRALHDGIRLASPAALDSLPGLPLDCPTTYVGVAAYRDYLARYAGHAGLEVTAGDVTSVARDGAGFIARLATGQEIRARAVVVATGMWSTPRWPETPGLDRCGVPVRHARDWRGPADVVPAGGALLVIGGATSAVEIAEAEARAGVRVTVAARRKIRLTPATFLGRDVHHYIGPIERLPPWLARGYCARLPTLPATDRGFSRLCAEGRIQVRPEVAAFEAGGRARFADGTTGTFDAVVAATGYTFAALFLPPDVARAPAGQLVARHNESVSWPGLYVVGVPCANRVDSEFLRGIARDAPLVARAVAARSSGR